MSRLIEKQRLTTPSGANVRIFGGENGEYVSLVDIAKALGYHSFNVPDSLLAIACKSHNADISIVAIPTCTHARGYVIKLEKLIPVLEAFCQLTLMTQCKKCLKTKYDEARMLAQQLIETLNRELFHKNICNPNLEIDEDLFDDVTGGLGIDYESVTHEARVMLKTLADEAGEDEHGVNNLLYVLNIFCNSHYDEFCMTMHGNYALNTLEEIAENLRGILARQKEVDQMESTSETTIKVLTVKDIEDIGERTAAVVKVYGLSLKDALRAVTVLKGEEIHRDLTPLIETLK